MAHCSAGNPNCHISVTTQNPMSFISCIHQRQYLKDVPWRPALMDKETYHNALVFRVVCSGKCLIFCPIFLPFASITFWLYFHSLFLFYLWVLLSSSHSLFLFFILTESCCRWSSSFPFFLFVMLSLKLKFPLFYFYFNEVIPVAEARYSLYAGFTR
jgi:hypothetical protein